MIVRTYARRSRCAGQAFSDGGSPHDDDDGDEMDEPLSLSQEASSSQPDPYGFAAFSSQGSSPWSFDSDLFGNDDSTTNPSRPPLPPPPRFSGNSSNDLRKTKDRKNVKIKKPEQPSAGRSRSLPQMAAPPAATATLMEAQEFGEMMEHVDEVTFALDGLRRGQPSRVHQASLLSLLTVCESAQQRRLLRARGMSKKIIDAIMGLGIDDSACSVAAAALFYVLATDVPDDYLMDSPSCVNFLLKLLNPRVAEGVDNKVPTNACKVLAVQNSGKRLDSSSTSIMEKVQEILLSSKALKRRSGDDDVAGRPELSTKWIALLTIEKACLSAVSIQDTTGAVSRVGGNFKERLRKLGGLDAIFSVAARSFSRMKGRLDDGFSSFLERKGVDMESIVLLLKCFKIMENATFMSSDNQNHLLEMKAKVDDEGLPLSFVRLVISAIKKISDLSLRQTYPHLSKQQPSYLLKDDCCWISSGEFGGDYFTQRLPYTQKSKPCQKRQRLSSSKSESSVSHPEETIASGINVNYPKSRTHHSPPDSSEKRLNCSVTSLPTNAKVSNVNPIRGSSGWISINISKSKINSVSGSVERFVISGNELKRSLPNESSKGLSLNGSCSKMSSVHLKKRPQATVKPKSESIKSVYDPFAFDEDDGSASKQNDAGLDDKLDPSPDPFAFEEDESGPTKWEMLAKRKGTSEKCQSTVVDLELEDGRMLMCGNPESTKEENIYPDYSCSYVVDEDGGVLEDCLLTAVKVLMNLTNDNPIGCQQIAACGGLDMLASLIGSHFPSFDFFQPVDNPLDETISASKSSAHPGSSESKHLNDHGLDFLVAILGLLVNLVEKDNQNRSRLASASIPVVHSGGREDVGRRRDVISLLCSIFLSNRGSGEAAGEEKPLSYDDEFALLQGEKEAEMMIIEAYAALLLAFLSTESKTSREAIAGCLPDQKLEVLVPVLEKFVAFHVSLNMISPETHQIVAEVIESCKGS